MGVNHMGVNHGGERSGINCTQIIFITTTLSSTILSIARGRLRACLVYLCVKLLCGVGHSRLSLW
jgi:hypothetical protein